MTSQGDSRSSIVRHQEWNPTLAKLDPLDLSQLILRLLGRDAMDGETTFSIIDESEILPRLLDADDIHEPGRVCRIRPNFAVHFDQPLHHNGLGLTAIQSVFQPGSSGSESVAERGLSFLARGMAVETNRFRMKTISGMQSRNL